MVAPTGRLPKSQRRVQVLDAARAVFVESGYYAAGMDDIAERAGVSKPVLYQHFSSKQDLYLALLDSALESLRIAIDQAAADAPDNKTRVRQTIGAYFAFMDAPDGAARLVFQSDLVNEPLVRDVLDRANSAIATQIGALIAEDTGLSSTEALILGAGLAGMAQTAARRWIDGDDDITTRDEAIDLVSRLAWRGIRGFPIPAATGIPTP